MRNSAMYLRTTFVKMAELIAIARHKQPHPLPVDYSLLQVIG